MTSGRGHVDMTEQRLAGGARATHTHTHTSTASPRMRPSWATVWEMHYPVAHAASRRAALASLVLRAHRGQTCRLNYIGLRVPISKNGVFGKKKTRQLRLHGQKKKKTGGQGQGEGEGRKGGASRTRLHVRQKPRLSAQPPTHIASQGWGNTESTSVVLCSHRSCRRVSAAERAPLAPQRGTRSAGWHEYP